MQAKLKDIRRVSKSYLDPARAIGAIANRTLTFLHRYCDLESMKSLEEFSHAKQLRNFRILAAEFAQHDSIENWNCVNEDGEKIPWYTYPAYEFVSSLKLRGLKITEYGSGNSSLFYLRKGARLTSIENNEEWYDKVSGMADGEERFTYKLCADERSYVAQDSIEDADLIVIDGRYRNACARFVCRSILEGRSDPHMIIFDNSDWYDRTVHAIGKTLTWQRVDFSGFGPINNYCWTTSIFFNPRKPLTAGSSIEPIGGVRRDPEDDVDFA